VVEPGTRTVDVNLLDLPASAHMQVPLLDSTGALGGDFVLGHVHYAQDGFLSMDFGLDQAANRLSLVVDVTGLNATGSLAASLAPGVQSLVNAQVGSWRQRMGVVPGTSGPAGLAPWVRGFADSGEVTPDHGANFGGGGQFDFRQSNQGWELGLNAQPTEHLAIGALLATSDGHQRVDGAGSTRFDGRSFGLYATWLSDAFYLDVSQRWTGIEARLHSTAASYETDASASTLSIEAGLRAWSTRGGLGIVPQLQYVRSEVSDLQVLDNGQADFANDGGVSERVRLGVGFDKQFQAQGFTWTPYASLNAVHEADGEYAHAINGGLLGSVSTQGTSAQLELGLGARRNRLSVTGGVSWSDGGALESVTSGQLVLRLDW
jgi:outer membrane autotransporter protein